MNMIILNLNIAHIAELKWSKKMKVKELIEELSKYDGECRVLLDTHGRCGFDEADEILGCYEEEIYDENDNIIETVISLYEY